MNYRIDIQILRGIAVISVILFHLFPSRVPNGYLGVDVFFVISGFLMASLYSYRDPKKSPVLFLKKRFSRIFPAYIGSLFLFLAFSIFYLSPYDFELTNIQALSSIFVVPNIYFWSSEDYFNSTTYKPLIHLWSLGIEMQFYILVPLITVLISKKKHSIIFITACSFALCMLISQASPKTAFFMLPTRIWEFGFGYIAALYLSEKKFKYNISPRITYLLLIFVIFCQIEFNPRPGLGALLTCTLTSLIIINNQRPEYKNYISRVIEKIGKYSYSLYLVHMPIIGLFWYEPLTSLDKDIPLDYRLLIYVLTTAFFTFIIYSIFEKKIDNKLLLKSRLSYAALLSILIIFFTGSNLNKKFMGEYATNISTASSNTMEWRCGRAFTLEKIIDKSKQSCLINNYSESAANVLIIGDSHLNAIKLPIINAANVTNYNIYLFNESCNPGNKKCTVKKIIEEVNKNDVKKIIIHGLHYKINYRKIIELKKSIASDIELFFIKPIPTFDFNIPKYLYENKTSPFEDFTNSNIEKFRSKYKKYERNFKILESNNIKTMDTLDIFCRPECLIYYKKQPLYYDKHHLTNTGASLMEKRILESIFKYH